MIHVIPPLWRKRVALGCLIGIIVGAVVLRWPMVNFALPYTTNPDEPYVINMIFDMMRRHTWIPNNFDRPHLSVYVAYGAVWIGQWWHPIDPALLAIPTDRITQVNSAFTDARIAMILASVASIGAAYWHLRQRQFTWGAWVGVLWLTLLPWHQEQSGFIAPDGMVGLFTFLFAGACWTYAQRPSQPHLWLVAVIIGMATGTKYNIGAALMVPLIMQWPLLQQREWRMLLRNGVILAAGSLGGFLVSTPGFLWSLGEIRANLDSQMDHYSRPDSNFTPWEWSYYLWFFQHEAWLWVGSVVATIGIVISVRQRRLVDIGLFAFFLFQVLFFMSRERHYMRNLMPLVVYGAVYMAIGGAWLVDKLARYITRRDIRIALVSAALLIQPLSKSVAFYQFMQRPYNLIQVDTYTATQPHGGIFLCTYELITVAITPSCDAIIINTAELATWQDAGVQQLVVNRNTYATWEVPAPWQRVAQIPASKQGGNGDPYDIYVNTNNRASVIGTTATTSDGVHIEGVRLGYGTNRDKITPLMATDTLVRQGEVLNINAYFRVIMPVSEPGWWLFVHVIDQNGQKVAERATPPRNDYAMARWQTGESVVVNADIPTVLPAGDYTLVLGFFRPRDGARMIISGSDDGSWRVPFRVVAR